MSPGGSWETSSRGCRLPSRTTCPSHRNIHSATSRWEAARARPPNTNNEKTARHIRAILQSPCLSAVAKPGQRVYDDEGGCLFKSFALIAFIVSPLCAQDGSFGAGLYQVMEK